MANPAAVIMSIILIHILAWFTPGPLFVLIVRNSITYSRKTGIFTAIGIAAGNFIHITYSVLGLTMISRSAQLYDIVKFLGAAYLSYLGIKTFVLRPRSGPGKGQRKKDISPITAARTGFLTNILSPKASLFFASIFSVLLSFGSNLIVYMMWVLLPLNSFLMASFLSTIFTNKKVRNLYSQYEEYTNMALGLMLIFLGIMVLFH